MANVKISELPVTTVPDDADVLPVVQSGTTKRITRGNFLSGLSSDAADLTYTPASLADWSGSADPGNIDGALDQLADRIATVEGTEPNAIHDNVSGEINAVTEKTALVDDDLVIIEDSESSFAKKKAKRSNLISAGIYVVAGLVRDLPPADALLVMHPVATAVTMPNGATNSQGKSLAAATAQTDFDIQKNGASIGTMRFAAAATTATFILTGPVSFAAGDDVRVVAPASPDATLSTVSFALWFSRP